MKNIIEFNPNSWLKTVIKLHNSQLTRFDKCPKYVLAGIVFILLCICSYSCFLSLNADYPIIKATDETIKDDLDLYKSIINEVSKGNNYYSEIIKIQRRVGFPTKPFFTVRSPVLAFIYGYLGIAIAQIVVIFLSAFSMLVWIRKLDFIQFKYSSNIFVKIALLLSFILVIFPQLHFFHEFWAGILIALSIGVRTPKQYSLAIILGLIAVLIRDIAIAYLGLMLVCAAFEKKWGECKGWGLAILFSCLFYAVHAHLVNNYVLPTDLTSQGWLGMNGWYLFVTSIYEKTLLIKLPRSIAFFIIPLGIFGWLSLTSSFALRVSGLICGYTLMIMLFARTEQTYWVSLITPLYLSGIVISLYTLKIMFTNILAKDLRNERGWL